MIIILMSILAAWVVSALVLVLALCAAARKPVPNLEPAKDDFAPANNSEEHKAEVALCLK